MLTIIWGDRFPEPVKQSVAAIFEKHRALVPDWCEQLSFYFDTGGNNGEYNAGTSVNYAYRRASISFYAGWQKDEGVDGEHDRDFVHELFHIVCEPAHDYGARELKRLLAGATADHRAAVLEEYVERCEMVVQDLRNLYLAGRLTITERTAGIDF